jgi:ribonuclease HI
MKITIYTDGSSRGNPGKGGWAAIILTEKHGSGGVRQEGGEDDDEVIELGGREDMTTNNRMELMGAIRGLQEVGTQPLALSQADPNSSLLKANSQKLIAVEVLTDSEYVKKGMTEWIKGWIAKGWKTSTKSDVLNKDLWQKLLDEETRLTQSGVQVTWKYVKAHVGIKGNERADTIATACADNASNLQLYRGLRSEYPYM